MKNKKLHFLLQILFILLVFFLYYGCSFNTENKTNSQDTNTESNNTTSDDNDLSEGFGNPSNFAKKWSITGSSETKPSLISGKGKSGLNSEYGLVFNLKKINTGTATLSSKINFEKDSLVTFYYRTDLDEQWDGKVEFYVDDKLINTYTGTNGTWKDGKFTPSGEWFIDGVYIAAGNHTLLWKAVGAADNNYSNYTTNSVYFDKLSVKQVLIPSDINDISDGFGKEGVISPLWTVTGNTQTKPKLVSGKSKSESEYGLVFNLKDIDTGIATLSRQLAIEENSLLSFYYRTDLDEQWDGKIEFYIDNKLINTYTGANGTWSNEGFTPVIKWDEERCYIPAGTHTLLWKAVGSAENNCSIYTTNSVYFDKLAIESVVVPSSLKENFDKGNLSNLYNASGCYTGISDDENFKKWVQYGNALKDTHSKVFKLATKNPESNVIGSSTLKIIRVNPEVESALSFDFKLDLCSEDYFEVTVDGVPQTIYIDGIDAGKQITDMQSAWRNGNIIISAGEHTIEFNAKKNNYGYWTGIQNAVYLDNLSLVPDVVEKVSLYPMGVQETYVEGFDLTFTAKALRSDGSVVNGKTVLWNGADNGIFHPQTQGNFTVTATIDGKSASNQEVKVHSRNYLSDSVTLNGITYTGSITNGSGKRNNSPNITFEAPTPVYSSFGADGFFVIKGKVKNKSINVYLEKFDNGKYFTQYIIRPGDFEERIWLRFGSGKYKVWIQETDLSYTNTPNGYLGAIAVWGGVSNWIYLEVNNTNDSLTAEEALYLLPSSYCQVDNFKITNTVHGVINSLSEDASAGQKLAALHDWQINHMYYDNDSVDGPRKVQDALHVLEYGMGVCEGYANLFTAFERAIGVKGIVICAEYNKHAWNNTYYDGQWFLVDPTWNDGGDSIYREDYTYFLVTKEQDLVTGVDHGDVAVSAGIPLKDGSWDGEDVSRNVVTEPKFKSGFFSIPDGLY